KDNQTYQVKYFFFNSTHSGYAYSKLFSVEISSSTQSDTKTTESTSNMPFPGFLLVLSFLTVIILIGNRRKR
ncbi:MAG: hypothetical protein ACFFFH_20475, partial [Candidatus Thorarchaeota archaeon]